jgi:hypothetical protein
MIEVGYDLEHAHLHESTDELERFFDLLIEPESLLSQPCPTHRASTRRNWARA